MIRLIKLLIWMGVICGVIFYLNYSAFVNQKLTENKVITLNSGDTIVPALKRELGFSDFYLKIYLKLHPDKKIEPQVGQYRLLKGESLESILNTINAGAMSVDKKLVVLEGWNIYDIDQYLTQSNLIHSGEFISEANNIPHYQEKYAFLLGAQSLEGYLYPDTYFINPHSFQIKTLVDKMLQNFQTKIYVNLLSSLTKKQKEEVIILASIVEKEERNPQEKSTVAGILKKRYLENWMIGADITACYAYKLTSEECKMHLSDYIYEKNEYNTRTMTGLPKTPICNPSFESVSAVINSKNTPYYYYLHDTRTGKVYYGRTNEEHIANKKYLK